MIRARVVLVWAVLACAALAMVLAAGPVLADGMIGGDNDVRWDNGPGSRIKDLTSVQGVRDNQLVGYGLVVGLQGSGDSFRNSPYTEQALASMLDRLGVNVRGVPIRADNVAAVAITADLPAFAGIGTRIDVNIASIGDATSLRGGTLIASPLKGGDGIVYAIAQGPITSSGYEAQGAAATLTEGIATAGRIANGALVERAIPAQLAAIDPLVLKLNNPDFRTAALIADAINNFANARYGRTLARETDLRTVIVKRPEKENAARFLARIGELRVVPDMPARVVMDQRTGTVVIGQNVDISTVAIAHGNLTVRVTEVPEVSQPLPFSYGDTVVVPRTFVEADENPAQIGIVGGTDLQTLVHGLNRIGVTPTDIISILQTVKSAGALQADLIIQ